MSASRCASKGTSTRAAFWLDATRSTVTTYGRASGGTAVRAKCSWPRTLAETDTGCYGDGRSFGFGCEYEEIELMVGLGNINVLSRISTPGTTRNTSPRSRDESWLEFLPRCLYLSQAA